MPSWSPTFGSKMNPPRSPRTSSSALLNASGRFFFQRTATPSSCARFVCIEVNAVPGVSRACSCGGRVGGRERVTGPDAAPPRLPLEERHDDRVPAVREHDVGIVVLDERVDPAKHVLLVPVDGIAA